MHTSLRKLTRREHAFTASAAEKRYIDAVLSWTSQHWPHETCEPEWSEVDNLDFSSRFQNIMSSANTRRAVNLFEAVIFSLYSSLAITRFKNSIYKLKKYQTFTVTLCYVLLVHSFLQFSSHVLSAVLVAVSGLIKKLNDK